MNVRRLVAHKVVYASVAAVALVAGTLVGGTAYEALNPAFDRVVWFEGSDADPSGDMVVRRALFADGRFLALTPTGYQAGIVDESLVNEVFATIRGGASAWASTYQSAGVIGQRMELALDGRSPKRIAIENPEMNLSLPPDIARLLRVLAAGDLVSAKVSFVPSSLRFSAVPAPEAVNEPIEPLPLAFPFDAATQPGGTFLGGSDLSIVKSVWPDLDERLEVGLAHRFVEFQGQRWRVSWRLDVDGIGPLPARAVTP